MKYLIVLTGYDRCGKDYIANKLEMIFKAKRVAFATPLKETVCKIIGINIEEFDKGKNKGQILEIRPSVDKLGKPMSYRNFIVKLGKDLRETLGDRVFINRTLEDLKNAKEEVGLITDTRFKSEENAIREFAKENNINLVVVKVKSELKSCGENGIKYEVPDIHYELEFRNTLDKEKFNRGFNCFVDKLSSRLKIDNPLKSTEKVASLIYDYKKDKFIKVK